MAISKNFVVKNGIEVATDLIIGDPTNRNVGIGTTGPLHKLHVNGGIGATTLSVLGISTFKNGPVLIGTENPSGISNQLLQVGSSTTTADAYISGSIGVGTANASAKLNVVPTSSSIAGLFSGTTSADMVQITQLGTGNALIVEDSTSPDSSAFIINSSGYVGISTRESTYPLAVYTSVFTGQTGIYNHGDLIVTGLVTSNTLSATNIIGTNLNQSGIATVNSLSIGSTQVISFNRQLQNIVSLDATTTATIESAIANAPNTFTDLKVSGISTLGSVLVSSGIVTATSGIVTYYGDGQYLTNVTRGIGIQTAGSGGPIGYGATVLDFRGPGISTITVGSGIGTINITGGVSIAVTSIAPQYPSLGNLWFNVDYARTFIYYDESALGVGTDKYWIDASPFNVGVITSLTNVSFFAGSASSPSLYFVGDTQTGLFSPSSGQQTFVSSGSSILNINSSGITVFGNVGVGTSSLTRKLEVTTAGVDNFIRVNTLGPYKSGIEFAHGNTVYSQLYYNNVSPYDLSLLQQYSTGSLILGTNNQERARIDSSGRLLVGTTSSTGVNSNTAPVLAGNFASFTGSVSATSGVATTLFSLENLNATYIVTAMITGTADAANYHAVYMVGTVVNNARVIQAIRAGGLLSLSLSGANVQGTQSSGTPQTISWSVTRLANL